MTIYEAHQVMLRVGDMDEGWLDTAARLERERSLTAQEQEAVDVLWREAVAAFTRLSAAVSATEAAMTA